MTKTTFHVPIPLVGLALVGVPAFGVAVTTTVPRARAAGATSLLPNLVADPPDSQSLETSNTEGGLKPDGESRLLLRFNGYIHNAGPGALDIRGSREKPAESQATEEEVERRREEEEEGPQNVEEELAKPAMKVSQRVFTTNAEETNIERPHEEETSAAEVVYVNADGHHHFHLQHVARYSLWNATKTAEVAPAQKVGFCLEDSQHVETGIGPENQVYADTVAPFRDFCQQYRPNATSLFEGVSPGWRDVYDSDLGFQWVEISNVLPGEYWLREDVNPTGVIKETGGANVPSYATTPTIISGVDAQAQTAVTQHDTDETLALTSKAWSDARTPVYAIVSPPAHGSVGAVAGNRVTYTPAPGYSGADSFTFSAIDPSSRFPRSPAVATVAIDVVGAGATPAATVATVAIHGAPATMIAGRNVQLSANTTNCPVLTWKASAGSITTHGKYTTPAESPQGGTATISASCSGGAKAEVTVRILGVSRPLATRSGHTLLMTTRVTEAGQVRLSAYLGRRLLGTCAARSRAGRTFSCRVTLGKHVSPDARIGVVATLHFGRTTLRALRPATAVASAKARSPRKAPAHGHDSLFGSLVDGPSTLKAWVLDDQTSPAGLRRPLVAIEGAPSGIVAGTSVKVSALVADDSPVVSWRAGAGSITASGLYTAPSTAPAAGTVVLAARSAMGAEDERTITILPVPASQAAPAAPLPAQAPSRSTDGALAAGLGSSASASAELARPQAVLIGHELIMTTRVQAPGRVRLSAYLGRSRIGGCAAETPDNRSFTCRLELGRRVALDARVGVLAELHTPARAVRSARPAAPVGQMKMTAPTDLVANGTNSASWEFLCGL